MTSIECAERQLRRFTRLREFPDNDDGRDDLLEALQKAPPDDLALEDWATQWVRESEYSPRPADVYAGFSAPLKYWERPPEKPRCGRCGDTGWEVIERGGLTGAQRCTCRKVLT